MGKASFVAERDGVELEILWGSVSRANGGGRRSGYSAALAGARQQMAADVCCLAVRMAGVAQARAGSVGARPPSDACGRRGGAAWVGLPKGEGLWPPRGQNLWRNPITVPNWLAPARTVPKPEPPAPSPRFELLWFFVYPTVR